MRHNSNFFRADLELLLLEIVSNELHCFLGTLINELVPFKIIRVAPLKQVYHVVSVLDRVCDAAHLT